MANIQDCIFYNISNEAVIDDNATPTNEHNTYFNCGTALKLTNTSLSSPVVKNSIFNDCDIDIHALDSNGLILYNSISNGNRINCTLDTTSIEDFLPLFINQLGEDFRLQHKYAGYFLDSPAVLLADDSRDAGAWDYTYTVNSTTWDSEELKDDIAELTRVRIPLNAQEKTTLSGNLKNYARAFLQQFTIKLKEGSNTKSLYHLERLLFKTGLKKLFPVGKGKFTLTSCDIAENTLTNPDTEFMITIPSGQLPITEDEYLDGLFLVTDTNPPSYSGNLPKYVFKIADYDPTSGIAQLEQTYNDYTHSTDWSSDVDIWKAIWVGGLQYKGIDTIGTKEVLKFDYSIGETDYQALERDQTKGWMLRVNLGSTYYYFRCYSNDDQFIWVDDIFDNESNLVLDDYYNALIDFIFTIQRLENIEGSQKNNKHGWKAGGEWFSTKYDIQKKEDDTDTIQVSTLTGHWGNEAQITLVETNEGDDEGI